MTSEWNERHVGDVVVIDIAGPLTISTQTLREQFTELFERGQKKVVVNLAGTTYMDSTSVGDLIVGHLQAAEHAASFKLAGVPPKIIQLLTMHHLIQVFDRYDDVEAAIASFD